MAEKIREVMTAKPAIVKPDTSLADVARVMRDKNVGCVLVSEDHSLRGLVTDRDLVVRGIAQHADPERTGVSEVASDVTATVGPDDDIGRAIGLMRERSVRRVVVMEGDRPVGVVSIGDLAMERDPNSVLADISAAEPNR
jgi:signal-transduction protein with cAMP-binding, CBS, and nucleotidyltransferase domain